MTTQEPVSRLLRGDRDEVPARPPAPRPASLPPAPDTQYADLPTGPGWREIPGTTHDLSEVLPGNVALLKVVLTTVDHQDCFRLELYWRHRLRVTDQPTALKRQRRPGFVLADVLDRPDRENFLTEVADCFAWLRLWSETKYELAEWLTDLRRELPTDLQLVIWDDTDFGIPWELFWHDMDGSPAWLGTAVQVIRWTTVHDAARHDQFSAERNQAPGGEILYYEEPGVDGPGATIHHPPGQPSYRAALTMEDLLEELAKPASYGLVYIRGHGHHSNDILQSVLAGVRLADLSRRSLPALGHSKSTVFLNACNSARPVRDKTLGDDGNRNFAEVFLRRRAGCVVASMAEVPILHSAAMARQLVHEARDNGVRVPEFLRAHRARYARNLPDPKPDLTEQEKKRILAFVYASVFAYFGHPESVFTLVRP